MKRRNFFKNAAVGAAGVTTAATVNAQSQSSPTANTEISWRMATSWLKGDLTFDAVANFCDRVAVMSNGQFTITPYEADELVPSLEVFDAVESGDVECGHTVSLYYLDRYPSVVFATTLPFGLMPHQQYAWYYYGGGLETMQQIHQQFNVVVFLTGSSGMQMGGWFNREVNTLEDLKGLKMRILGFGAEVMQRLGVETVALGVDKIYPALAKGEVDAAEWLNPHDDEYLRLHEVAKYYYYPGWYEPGTTYEIVINQKQWLELPKSYQRIVQSAAAEANLISLASFDAANGEALERIVAGGIELKPFSPEILEAAYIATQELLAETASQDPSFKKVYEQWQEFRRQIYRWNQINELSFESFSLES